MGVRDRVLALVVGATLVGAACAGADDDQPGALLDEVPDHSDEAAALAEAPVDAAFPDGPAPDVPVGSYGFSRYVWSVGDDGVLPTLIEGPRGQQARCQDEDLPCSYTDLKELAASGDPIPPGLDLSADELDELVGQLDQLSAKLTSYASADEVCAEGYQRSSSQNPNMGIHMTNPAYVADGFVVDRPEILLLAMEGGESLRQSEIGSCEGDRWTGDPGMQVVGSAFMLPMTDDHPEGFAGSIDNWHIHFNTCAGADEESGSLASPSTCEAEGGQFQEVLPIWMMHAYAVPDYDSQQGVFSMFNGSVWPLNDNEGLTELRTESQAVEGVLSPINNFSFGRIEADVGEEVVFANSDSVPHTVTSGTPESPRDLFDSGAFGTGQNYTQSFDEPGTYEIFCTLHPQMTGLVEVTS